MINNRLSPGKLLKSEKYSNKQYQNLRIEENLSSLPCIPSSTSNQLFVNNYFDYNEIQVPDRTLINSTRSYNLTPVLLSPLSNQLETMRSTRKN